jgi:hypothetical protein
MGSGLWQFELYLDLGGLYLGAALVDFAGSIPP